jgi:hypothetical protein
MTTQRRPDRRGNSTDADQRRDGEPRGDGPGRTSAAGRTDAYPASDAYPGGENEVRTPAWFVPDQADEQEHQVQGGSGEVTTSLGTEESQFGNDTPPSAGDAENPGQPS